MTSRSRCTACWRRPSRPTTPGATSPSISIPRARFSDGKPVTRRRRAVLLGTVARPGPPQPPPVLFQGGKGRSARSAHRAVRLRRRQRPRTAADPRPDADTAPACHRSRNLRGNLDDGDRSAPAPTASLPSGPAPASRWRAIPTIGDATCRSTGACGISTRSGSTIYREANGEFEAFKRGLYDFRVETEPLRWHDGYDFPAARKAR